MSTEKGEKELIESLKDIKNTRDMMLTAYSILRDRCKRNNMVIDSLEIGFSIIVIAMTFYDYPDDIFGNCIRYLVIALAMVTLFLAFLKQKWDFGRMAERYSQAANKCYEAKSLLRTEIEKGEIRGCSQADYTAVVDRVDAICYGIEPIPDNKFNRLKYKHLRKVDFSKYLSSHESQSWFVSVIKYNLGRKE